MAKKTPKKQEVKGIDLEAKLNEAYQLGIKHATDNFTNYLLNILGQEKSKEIVVSKVPEGTTKDSLELLNDQIKKIVGKDSLFIMVNEQQHGKTEEV